MCPFGDMMTKRIPAANVQLKRVYDPRVRRDGTRILIDRLWPRGVTKEAAAIDEWFKDISPSTRLRQWFDHDPARWKEFQRRYSRGTSEFSTTRQATRFGATRSGHAFVLCS